MHPVEQTNKMSRQRHQSQLRLLGAEPLRRRRNNNPSPLMTVISGKGRGMAWTPNASDAATSASTAVRVSSEEAASSRSYRRTTTAMPSTTTMSIVTAAASTTTIGAAAATSGGRSLRLITICLVTVALFAKMDIVSGYPSLMILPRPSSSGPLFGEIRSSGAFNAIHRPVPSAEVTPPAQEMTERTMMSVGNENANSNDAVEKAEKAQPEFVSARKRAFDRLDVSPFDFEALSKRFNDDDNDFFYGRRRRAFDRLDDNPFFGLMTRRRRSFDRLEDGPFMLGKRSQPEAVGKSFFDDTTNDSNTPLMVVQLPVVAKRPFDRLEYSTFGMTKRSEGTVGYRRPLSIIDLVRQLERDY